MKRIAVAVFTSIVMLSACATSSSYEAPASTRAPTPTTTTLATTTTYYDPAQGRNVWGEFSLLTFMDDSLAELCEPYPTTEDCYDAVERGTPDFENVIREAFGAAFDSGGSYQANQYGCHSDGRCLDGNDQWCDESEYDWEYDVCYGYEYDDREREYDSPYDW
jgi:hypothetical protein